MPLTCRSREFGFTLLEVLLGGAVLTMGMVSLLFVAQGLMKDLTAESTDGEMPPATYPILERYIDGCIELIKANPDVAPLNLALPGALVQGATLSATVSLASPPPPSPPVLGSNPKLVRYKVEVFRENALIPGVTPVSRIHFWRLETTTPAVHRGQ